MFSLPPTGLGSFGHLHVPSIPTHLPGAAGAFTAFCPGQVSLCASLWAQPQLLGESKSISWEQTSAGNHKGSTPGVSRREKLPAGPGPQGGSSWNPNHAWHPTSLCSSCLWGKKGFSCGGRKALLVGEESFSAPSAERGAEPLPQRGLLWKRGPARAAPALGQPGATDRAPGWATTSTESPEPLLHSPGSSSAAWPCSQLGKAAAERGARHREGRTAETGSFPNGAFSPHYFSSQCFPAPPDRNIRQCFKEAARLQT